MTSKSRECTPNFLWQFGDRVVLGAHMTSSSRPPPCRQAGLLSRPIKLPSSTYPVLSLFSIGDAIIDPNNRVRQSATSVSLPTCGSSTHLHLVRFEMNGP